MALHPEVSEAPVPEIDPTIAQSANSKLACKGRNWVRANNYFYHLYYLTCSPYRHAAVCIIL